MALQFKALLFIFSLIPFSLSSPQFMSLSHNETISCNLSNATNECCICLKSEFETLNETEFKGFFGFYCQHSSINICTDCWFGMLHRYGINTKCPLCRACKPAHTNQKISPYIVIQPGYHDQNNHTQAVLPAWKRTKQRCDISNGCLALWLRGTYNVFCCLYCTCICCDDGDCDMLYIILCSPLVIAGSVCCSASFCVTTMTSMTLSICCCADCCHVCFPKSGCRPLCIRTCIDCCL